MSAISEQKARAAEAQRRTLLEIAPNNVHVDAEGFFSRSLVVRLPKGFTADELKEVGHWRAVQVSPRAVRRFDKLMLIAFDESWIAEAHVSDADHSKAVLTRPRVTDFSVRYDSLFEDDQYRIKWDGRGYFVERKGDGHAMTGSVATAALAQRDLAGLYPRHG